MPYANPEKAKEYKRQWAERNRARVRTSARASYLANRDERIERATRWNQENPDARREIVRRHNSTPVHREAVRSAKARRRARCQDGEHVDCLVVLELHDGVCGICGKDVDPLNFHIDHDVPLIHGGLHTYENTQPAHPTCNLRKGARV